ncbi:MAG: hypothetical protein ACI4R9_08035 [Kiritimatiellia bacterium]
MLTVCGTALLIAAAVVVALHARRRPAPPPDAPAAQTPAEVRVKAVERKAETMDRGEVVAASGAVAIVCGEDAATADRYEARNDALRSIARRRDLPEKDVAALIAYLRWADNAMRVERVAALKNDVMNLLRNQEPPVEGLAETLMGMIEGKGGDCGGAAGVRALPGDTVHPPVVIDYCIQHLGAMVNELDDAKRSRVREVFVRAAREKTKPYAGTALYSLAEDKRATAAQEGELKRLTLALCKPEANHAARIAAIQLAGERGFADALPVLRETLSAQSRDAVLDTVCIGSIGFLGNADDITLIERFKGDSRRAAAVEAAIKRIKGREDIGTPTAGKEASLTLRPLLRAVQPHEIRFNSFGGLGAVPSDKENIVGGNNRGFATRS